MFEAMKPRQIAWTAAISVLVVLGYKTYEAKTGKS
jgi:hypothetical protein